MRPGLILAWTAALVAARSLPARAESAIATAPVYDCGPNAVYLLLHVAGRPVTLDAVRAALPPRHPDGYSMTELAGLSRALGLPLEGVRFQKRDVPLDRPAIAFFDDGRAGHFAVLRPVGTTGTMVQVIDPPRVPRVVDYDRLFADTPWAGRLLVPRDAWPARLAPAILAAGAPAALAVALRRRRRPSKAGVAAPTAA
jgi:hypothetical protein